MWSELFSRLTAVLRRRRPAIHQELDEEIQAHIDLRADDNIASGMSPDEARLEARRHFGNRLLVREQTRESWSFPSFESVLQDLRYGLRSIFRKPAFALAVILTIALGIGANTAIFSVVYAVLLRPLPYPAGERLLVLGESAGKAEGISVTWINFQHWRTENHTFEDMAGYTRADLTMTGQGEAQITHAAQVTAAFFPLTGARTQLGRVFTEDDDRVGAAGTVVLTHEFWNRVFHADPRALEATLMLNGQPYQVIGVLAPAHRVLVSKADYYLALGRTAAKTRDRGAHGSMRVLARMKPGITRAAAQANLDEILKRLALSDPGTEASHRASSEFLTESITGDVQRTLVILMGAAGLLLLIACANVASLLLVRSASRAREMAIRVAIGAGRLRVTRQILTENLTLSALGGVAGIALAVLCLQVLRSLAPSNLPRLAEVELDLPVLGFAAAATLLTGLLAGLAPVLAASKVDVSTALKDGAAGSGQGIGGQRMRSAIVVCEVAITLVLAFASGLLLRSLITAQSADPGFDSRGLLALELQLPSSAYPSIDHTRQFYARLEEDVRRIPGVTAAALVVCPPGAGDCGDWWYSPLDRPAPARNDVPLTLFTSVDPGYFQTMGIRLLAGREFTGQDRKGSSGVTILSDNVARRWWPTAQAALGQRIKFGGPYQEGGVLEVVGVVADVSQNGLDGDRDPQMYFPFAQETSRAAVVMMRTRGDAAALVPAVRQVVAAIDRNLPIQSLAPIEKQLGATLARRKFSTLLLSTFALLAIFLAALGIYGVLNYWVSLRHRELAVRMALGASRMRVTRWAGSYVLRLAAAGVLLGALGSWGASSWLAHMVYGVSSRSLVMLLAAVVVVILVSALAASLPVWRATRVDITSNLREA